MKLDVKNRLLLIGMLPQQGNLSEMVDIYDLVRDLKLSDEEKGAISYVENGNYVKWDFEKDPNKDININSSQMKIIKKTIEKLDKENKINLEMVPLIQIINGLV